MPTWVTLRPLYPDFARACSPRPQPPKSREPLRRFSASSGQGARGGYCCARAPNNGVNGEGRASTYTNGILLTITLEAARAALRIGKTGSPHEAATGAQFSQSSERGKAELHLVASG
jgi:hypothetical protein